MNSRPTSFRVGLMRERILVESVTKGVSDAGDSTETWSTFLSDEPAKFEPTSGGETLRGRQVEAGISAIFTVRYRSGYLPTMRITHNGTTYGIVYVKQVDGQLRYLELYCKS